MKKALFIGCLSVSTLVGCHGANSGGDSKPGVAITTPPPVNPDQNETIATIRGEAITFEQMKPILMEGYGLNIMMALVQKDLAEQEASKVGVQVTPADVDNERKITLANLVRATQQMQATGAPTTEPDEDIPPAQQEQMLHQLLMQQHISMAEFDIILEVNATLRKMAGPRVEAHLSEDVVREKFNQIYGERVRVRRIVCKNMDQIALARHDLAAGKSFEDVVRARSIDRQSATLGGEVPSFALNDNSLSPTLRAAVAQLKPGEVSDPIEVDPFIYIIKLEEKIPPTHAKFEDYKDSVRKTLYDEDVQAAINVMRQKMGQIALATLHIKDPVVEKQWDEKVNARNNQIEDTSHIRKDLDQEHMGATTGPSAFDTTVPSDISTDPADAAPPANATMPATAPAAQ